MPPLDAIDDERPCILVVDDSPVDRQLTATLLRKGIQCRVETVPDGKQALEFLGRSSPALVLTDVRMPGLSGLDLVERICADHPHIPVVVMTAHGSEEIAAEALRKGAAHYVAKAKLAKHVVQTVQDVLVVARERQQELRLRNYWQRSEVEFCLNNDVTLIAPLVSHLQQSLLHNDTRDASTRVRIGVALHEALRNAIDHGNLELDSRLRDADGDTYYQEGLKRRGELPYATRRVHVSVRETQAESCYVIRDEGPGFDIANFDYDPTDSANLLRPSGRGLFLIKTFMDDVQFNQEGNEITLVHRRKPSGQHVTEPEN